MKQDLVLLLLRLGFGGTMLFAHGLQKLSNFEALSTSFPDPLGIGPLPSLTLAVFAEVFCAAALMLGILTRYAAMPLLVTMLVALVCVHADEPFQKKEMALLFALVFTSLIIAGGGRLAVIRPKP